MKKVIWYYGRCAPKGQCRRAYERKERQTWTKLEKGSQGTVIKIEKDVDETLVWVDWDNGEQLALLVGIDKYKIIKK